MPPLHLKQEFPTLKAFKEALHAWAIEAHFEPRILKSDTGRVRVGCKRNTNCPFVVRCNWERKGGREPLARVTVLRETHSCLDGLDWNNNGGGVDFGAAMNGSGLEIRQDHEGNIVGGARVLEQRSGGEVGGMGTVLPKVQRNSASRLPFLMSILPGIMEISKETTPVEIREVLMREYGAEVHLQQCRRAKTEILKKREGSGGEGERGQDEHNGSLDGHGEVETEVVQQAPMFGDMGGGGAHNANGMKALSNIDGTPVMNGNGNGHMNGNGSMSRTANTTNNNNNNNNSMNGNTTLRTNGHVPPTPNPQESPHSFKQSSHPFTLHTAAGVVTPVVPDRGTAALRAVGEQPIKCPYCINHRWLKSIQDAVEHMSMHVIV